nr:sigma-70 family RNA polymerase sigma factor [Amphibacillus sediminis]
MVDDMYKTHVNTVFKYLMCLTNNVDLSEELTQETFFQAVKSIHRFNGECKISVWLCQIAKHSYYKYLEKNKKYKHEKIDVIFDSTDNTTPETEYINQENKISIFHKIHLLDEPYKEVILLRVLGGLSFKEIGEIQGKNENWARVIFYRAKKKIKEEKYYNEAEL